MHRDFGEIENYFVYSYEHLDDLSFLRSPNDILPARVVAGTVDERLERVGNFLRQHGWEGDGDAVACLELRALPGACRG